MVEFRLLLSCPLLFKSHIVCTKSKYLLVFLVSMIYNILPKTHLPFSISNDHAVKLTQTENKPACEWKCFLINASDSTSIYIGDKPFLLQVLCKQISSKLTVWSALLVLRYSIIYFHPLSRIFSLVLWGIELPASLLPMSIFYHH